MPTLGPNGWVVDPIVSTGPGGYTLPPATTATLGGVKAGSGLAVGGDGTLSATGGGGGSGSGTGIDATDIGFDVILLAGQSNMAGRGTYDALIDLASERIMQFGGYNGDARFRTIFSGADPLHMVETVETGLVGPGTHAARAYCSGRIANRKVLLVPGAVGGTTLVAGSALWAPGNPGGQLYELAISQSNLAITAALALYPNSRFVGAFWHQGESDGDNGISQAAYATALKALITGFRARITGAANSWFVIGGLCPEGIAATPARAGIKAAHIQVANEIAHGAYVDGPSGLAGTDHYTAPGIRILGARMGVAVETARNSLGTSFPASAVTVSRSAASGVVGSPVMLSIGTNYPLTGAQAETITLASNVAGAFSVNPVTLNASTATATVTFTPSATGTATITATAAGTPALTAGSIGYTSLASATVPAAPTIGVAVAGDGYIDVAFTRNSDGGAAVIDSTATLSTGQFATGTTSPIRVTAPNGTAATATVKDRNSVGASAASAASNAVTPVAPAGSFATWNPADKNASITLSNGNKTATAVTGSPSSFESVRSNVGKAAGKWYWECTLVASRMLTGIGAASASLTDFAGSGADGWGYYDNGNIYHSGGGVGGAAPASFTVGDVIGHAMDMDAKTLQFYKNGVASGPLITGLTGTMFAMISLKDGSPADTVAANFGATSFAYAAPSGFVGLQ